VTVFDFKRDCFHQILLVAGERTECLATRDSIQLDFAVTSGQRLALSGANASCAGMTCLIV
jgi:hypothetical protein